MHFAFTEDQAAITQAAREMLVETTTPADLRQQLAAGAALDEARWRTIVEMGLPAMLAPEARGGLGLAPIDFIGIAEAAGYVALPEPLVDLGGVAVPLLAALEDDRGWLARAVGGAVVAVGHPLNRFVADADTADALLLTNGVDLHLVEAADVRLTRQKSFDPFRRLFSVEWTPGSATRVGSGWAQAAGHGTVFAAAQLIGLAQRAIDLGVAYAKERTQFGKPIGGYQAVKHLLASAQVAVEFARPVVHAAAIELPLDNAASHARVAHAKYAAGDAADLATRTAVQVHGAMGMTWEVDLHFFLKRAMGLRFAWGAPAVQLDAVVRRITGLPTGPDASFASELA